MLPAAAAAAAVWMAGSAAPRYRPHTGRRRRRRRHRRTGWQITGEQGAIDSVTERRGRGGCHPTPLRIANLSANDYTDDTCH